MSDLQTGIRYEAALAVLGQALQPWINAIEEEQRKAAPSQPFIRYCEMRQSALSELQYDLEPSDRGTIDRILDAKAILPIR